MKTRLLKSVIFFVGIFSFSTPMVAFAECESLLEAEASPQRLRINEQSIQIPNFRMIYRQKVGLDRVKNFLKPPVNFMSHTGFEHIYFKVGSHSIKDLDLPQEARDRESWPSRKLLAFGGKRFYRWPLSPAFTS